MKKIMIIPALLCSLLLQTSHCNANETIQNPPKGSTIELYQDIIVSLLLPKIQNQIDVYYLKCFRYSPHVYPYEVKFLDVERVNGYRSFLFLLHIQTRTVVGPHIDVGLDQMLFEIDASGNVTLQKFEHIRSYELPDRYKDYKKKCVE